MNEITIQTSTKGNAITNEKVSARTSRFFREQNFRHGTACSVIAVRCELLPLPFFLQDSDLEKSQIVSSLFVEEQNCKILARKEKRLRIAIVIKSSSYLQFCRISEIFSRRRFCCTEMYSNFQQRLLN